MESGVEVLEFHTRALDLADASSRRELEAYVSLGRQHRVIARQLHALATELGALRSLPMGRHDERVMADPQAVSVFERFVRAEEALVTLLEERLQHDRRLLAGVRQGT
jgi:hypothetical protein